MRRTAILEVADLVSDRVLTFPGERPYIATGDLDDFGGMTPTDFTYENRPSRADLQVQPNDVCMARMKSTLKVRQFGDGEDRYILSTGFALLRPRNRELDPAYLRQWLRTDELQRAKDRLCTGAIQPAITNGGIAELEIPLPPVEEQRRIAHVLDLADALRAKRRTARAKLDTLTPAMFIDMFGDPNTAATEARASIGEVAKVVTGNTPSRADPDNYGDAIEWIKSDNILTSGGIDRATEMLSDAGRRRGRSAPPGASLIVCIAGSPQSIGRVGLLDRQAAFNQQINAVIPGDGLLPEFLFHQLKVGQRLVQKASTNSMKGMVSKSALCGVQLLVPPIKSQAEFVSTIKAASPVAAASQSSLERLDVLFASLQQRAFRGEL